MNKLLLKISKNLFRIKEKYPELAEIINKKKETSIKLSRLEVNRILDMSSKELIEFIKEFYGVEIILVNKSDLKPKNKKKEKKKNVLQLIPEEEWKIIYDKYKISNLGRIINWKNRILTPKINKSGFYYININNKPVLIHTLVAKNFPITNKKSKQKKFITHIDGDKSNNSASNLKWVTFSSIRNGYKPGKTKGEVYKYDLDGNFIEKYKNTKEASIKSGVNLDNLYRCLSNASGQRIKYKNNLWERKQ